MSTKLGRTKSLLAGKGITRKDSDDELGTEEQSWEWITSDSSLSPCGARFGDFVCSKGDCVLLKSEIANEAWVAIVCEFKNGADDEKLANFMWFSTSKEVRNKKKRRDDALEVCLND